MGAASDLPDEVEDRFASAGVTVERMPTTVGQGTTQDAALTRTTLERLGSSWLVLDGYGFDGSY